MSINRKLLFRTCVVVLVALAATMGLFNRHNSVSAAVSPGSAPANPTCYPSCQPNDARFFSLAGSNLFTFAGGSTTIGLRVNGSANPANFTVGVFDGDNGGLWDQDTANTGEPVVFELFGDSNNDGTADTGVLDTLPNGSMVDNGWAYFSVTHNALARLGGAGTDYVYLLRARLANPNNLAGMVQNNFKILADSAQTQIFITPQVLSFQAFQNNAAEFLIIHPNGLPPAISNYDGKWNFSFLVTAGQDSVNIFNGDFDIGSVVMGSALDTDDPTSPNFTPDNAAYGALAFSLGGAMGVDPEGVGTTIACSGPQVPQGCPPDDSTLIQFRRPSSIAGAGIVTRLFAPSGGPYLDNNPSGTNEWELFRVAAAGAPLPALTDVSLGGPLPTGLWTYQIDGMDLANLFALRFDKILLVEPYTIGDFVYCDGATDTGVPGVLMELLDPASNVVKTTVTNGSGFYSFAVEPGTWTVRVAASNFNVGGPLEGRTSTTGGNSQTKVVVNSNLLTYDFGYNCVPTTGGGQGCTPGYWKQSQHFDSWVGFTPNQNFGQVFFGNAGPANCNLCSMTLLQALGNGGGGEDAFGRHAVSALLSASSGNVNFLFTVPQVKALVVGAYLPGGDFEVTKNIFAAQNEKKCPLN